MSIAISAGFLYLALRGLDWADFLGVIRSGRYEILLMIVPLACLNYLLRAFRWNSLVGYEKPVPLRLTFWANMAGYMGNAFLPARAGELLRSVLLGRRSGLGTSYVFATALTERAVDAIALVLIGGLALVFQSHLPVAIGNAALIVALLALVALAVVLAAPFQERRILRLVARMRLPAHLTDRISAQIARFLLGMRSLQSVRRLLRFTLLTAVVWLVDAMVNMLGVQIISRSLSLGQALVLLAALGLSSAIPSTPGYVGVYQWVGVSVLAPFGFARADALAYVLISQVMYYLIVGVLGMVGVWQMNRDTGSSGQSVARE